MAGRASTPSRWANIGSPRDGPRSLLSHQFLNIADA